MAKRSYRWNETTPGPTTWSDVGSLVAAHIEQEFLDHAKRDVILERLGLTPQAIAEDTVAALARNTSTP